MGGMWASPNMVAASSRIFLTCRRESQKTEKVRIELAFCCLSANLKELLSRTLSDNEK